MASPSPGELRPPGLDRDDDAVRRAGRWARWPAYVTVALLAASQAIGAWIVDPWLDPRVPFDPDLLDPLLPAIALTALAGAAGVGWRLSRRLLAADATSRRLVAWAAATALLDGAAAVLLWAAFLVNVAVA